MVIMKNGKKVRSFPETLQEDHQKASLEPGPDSRHGLLSKTGLLAFPPELRLEIYQHLVSSGSVAFLAACRCIHDEAAGLVSKYSICRLRAGYEETLDTSPASLPPEIEGGVQNLEIHINTTSPKSNVNFSASDRHILRSFANPDVVRMRCNVVIECNAGQDSILSYALLAALRSADGFQTVLLQVRCVRSDDQPQGCSISEEQLEQCLYESLRSAKNLLHPTLARTLPGEYYKSASSRSMCGVFHPREQWAEKSVRLPAEFSKRLDWEELEENYRRNHPTRFPKRAQILGNDCAGESGWKGRCRKNWQCWREEMVF